MLKVVDANSRGVVEYVASKQADVAALHAKVAEIEAAIQALQQPTQVEEKQGSDE